MSLSSSICTEQCRARVECLTCKKPKAPIGRSVAPAMAGDLCNDDCPGYRNYPTPGHLWPDEDINAD